MISVKTILVPVDFSEASRQAVKHGFSLARLFQADLLLAHIVPNASPANYILPTETYAVELGLEESAKNALAELIPRAADTDVRSRIIVKVGEVEANLVQIVSEGNVDLVVMGTHGRRALGRWLLGSVTERLLRKVPVPVLTVSHLDPGKELVASEPWTIRRIIYATDLYEDSAAAFEFAVSLGRRSGAEVTVLHCVEPITGTWSGTMTTYLEDQYAHRVKTAEERLASFVEANRPEGVVLDSVLLEGKPFEKILEYARNRSDLIVINLHSRTQSERAFLGSTSERVVRLAGIPVLAVPIAEAGEVAAETSTVKVVNKP